MVREQRQNSELSKPVAEGSSVNEGAFCYIKPGSAVRGEIPGCGMRPGTVFGPEDKPGYKVCHFVREFVHTKVGVVPRLMAYLKWRDRLGNALARLGLAGDWYKVVPGLYSVGFPDKHAPVIVTANFKLTFDKLRVALSGIDAWLLVVDTMDVNVWCATGKGLFSAQSLVQAVRDAQLSELVKHRTVLVPQYAAVSVSAHEIREQCGFDVEFGPLRPEDLQAYFENGRKATPEMRTVSYDLKERAALLPIGLMMLTTPALLMAFFALVLSGIGPDLFSWSVAASRWLNTLAAMGTGIFSGAVVMPLWLQTVPGVRFSTKGMVTGILFALPLCIWLLQSCTAVEVLALGIQTVVVSSYASLTLTGVAPFTSPSGVEKELKTALPLHIGGLLFAGALWVAARFIA